MNPKDLKRFAEDRIERLTLEFTELQDVVETCCQRLDKRSTTLQKAQVLRTTLRGLESTVQRLEREIIEQMTVLRTLHDVEEGKQPLGRFKPSRVPLLTGDDKH